MAAHVPSIGTRLDAGILTIAGTRADDSILMNLKTGKNGKVFLSVTGLGPRGRRGIVGGSLFRAKDVAEIHLLGGAGNDYLSLGGGAAEVVGDSTRLNVPGSPALTISAVIDGGDGDDNLVGGIGNDTVTGGLGNDRINGGDGANDLSGGDGNDTISGGNGADRIDGGDGADMLNGNGIHYKFTTTNEGTDGVSARSEVVVNPNGSAVDSITGGLGSDQFFSGDQAAEWVDKGGSETVLSSFPNDDTAVFVG
jgi:Ca2+-binding RTX toxin-like protein